MRSGLQQQTHTGKGPHGLHTPAVCSCMDWLECMFALQPPLGLASMHPQLVECTMAGGSSVPQENVAPANVATIGVLDVRVMLAATLLHLCLN
jgi:hypothetical protein